ncbi:hypothetical protein LZC95_19530 [Pendulispora brunnea]|uniref:Uncharacterized protein n=1 Tax=Pendulispora brunnea TaxID=2905690 RepID=A0ABZ2KKD1_9BACT
MTESSITALNGTLVRVGPNAWQWIDGTPEPRVEDLLLRRLAPNFRVSAGHIEIPIRWRDLYPGTDQEAAAAVQQLVREYPDQVDIFAEATAEMLDDHRVWTAGYRVPRAAWDAVMSRAVGCSWDAADEADLLERARALRGE